MEIDANLIVHIKLSVCYLKVNEDRAKSLQHALLNYLWCNLKSDPALAVSIICLGITAFIPH